MPQKVVRLTPNGHRNLERELVHLRTVKRWEVAQRHHEATEEGGELEENVSYETAKVEQALVEGCISELEELLARARIAEIHSSSDEIHVGSIIVVHGNGHEPENYTIVGATEANPRFGMTSYESPMGQALLGRHTGDEIMVDAPAGPLRYRIIKVN